MVKKFKIILVKLTTMGRRPRPKKQKNINFMICYYPWKMAQQIRYPGAIMEKCSHLFSTWLGGTTEYPSKLKETNLSYLLVKYCRHPSGALNKHKFFT